MSEKDIPGPRNSGSGDIGYGFVDLGRPDDDHPFIVLTETKFSFRCIPVWIGTLL